MPAQPPWWSSNIPELVNKRDQMPSECLQVLLGVLFSSSRGTAWCVACKWCCASATCPPHTLLLPADVEKLQSMYVRYKCQPEAQITSSGWDLATSQRYADQLAAEEQQAYVREESLLYNGLAPTGISLRIIEAPAEFAVPVKQDRCGQRRRWWRHAAWRGRAHTSFGCAVANGQQAICMGSSRPSACQEVDPHSLPLCCVGCCRRLTPNFKIRAEVGFNTRCSFPLTLKVYVITQQEKDSVPEWVPDDFLDPDLPQV